MNTMPRKEIRPVALIAILVVVYLIVVALWMTLRPV